jgi:hypothetical protein
MKKIIFVMALASMGVTGFAQSEKFVSAMQPKVIALDTTYTVDALKDLANSFERIADAEKTQWLPYYYAALATVNAGNIMMLTLGDMMANNSEKLDPLADKAEQLLSKAEALSKDNSEIYVVKKMILSLKMMGDVMTRAMTYGPSAQEALATAKNLNPENPRIYLLEGQDKFVVARKKQKSFLKKRKKSSRLLSPKLRSIHHGVWEHSST